MRAANEAYQAALSALNNKGGNKGITPRGVDNTIGREISRGMAALSAASRSIESTVSRAVTGRSGSKAGAGIAGNTSNVSLVVNYTGAYTRNEARRLGRVVGSVMVGDAAAVGTW